MALRMENMYVSCIKMFGVPIVPPLMTDEKRQEMKEYKEKAMTYEHKIKGKRVSLDSGVMIASSDMQKLDNVDSPTNIVKEPIFCDIKLINVTKQSTMKTDSSISSETLTLASEEEVNNLISLNDTSDKDSISMKSDNPSSNGSTCDKLIPKQESTLDLTKSNMTVHDNENLNGCTESINKGENMNLPENSFDTLVSKQYLAHDLAVTKSINHDGNDKIVEQIPRVRSNSYTLSSPSPIMVAFLNSQVQQQLIESSNLVNNTNYLNESKSEPPSIFVVNKSNNKALQSKSISFNSVSEPLQNQELVNDSIKYRHQSFVNGYIDHKTISNQKQDITGSVTTIGTNISNDESVGGSVITVFNSNSNENHTSPSSTTCKSTKHCCCRHSDDDEYSLSSNNIQYKTPEELNLETERLRIEKLDIERRHQEELSNLIKKQRAEQEQIAVRYYLVSQSSSGISLDNSECSEYFSNQQNNVSPSILSGMTATNDKSLLSDTSSIISNCSINKNLACSSPRQKVSSPYLQQNIKFYHKMRGGLAARWAKAPTEVENSAATIINAGARGYLTRRLLRTEKAQLLKKTILDSLKTALILHMELKKQQPTESDLELHRRIINQLTTACYDLNDLILGSVQERMTVIRGDRKRLMAVKMRRKSSSALNNKSSSSLKQPKKSISSYSLSRKTSSNYTDKRSYKK